MPGRWFLGLILAAVVLGTVSCGGSSSSSNNTIDDPEVVVPEPNEPPLEPNEPVAVVEFDPHWDSTGAYDNAASCGSCHSAAGDGSDVLRDPDTGADISPYTGRQHSVMAHAFNDPYYRAKMEDEITQFPQLAGTIEDKCLTCHTPMARTHAHETGMLTTGACLDEEGCYRLEDAQQSMMAREAISCTLCHQLDPDTLEGAISGEFSVDAQALTIYGPYMNARSAPMMSNTRYSVTGSPHIQDSASCGTCHDLDTPSIDVTTDQLTGRQFVEQAPYREWRNSRFNSGTAEDRHCQDCHMPEIEDYRTAIATTRSGNSVPGWPQREGYSQHSFLGGNAYLLELLSDYRTELGIANTTTEQGFSKAIAANEDFLAGQSARLRITRLDLSSSQLDVSVMVENLAGHKLPTSFPSRRVWVNLIVRDAGGQVLFESGTPDADGMLAQDTQHTAPECVDLDHLDAQAQCYTPHYDVITKADQVAVYEAVMGDTLGRVAYVLLYGDVYLKDNRIPPAGFTTSGPEYLPAIETVGAALSDPDFNRGPQGEGSGTDTVHYQLDWAGLPGSGLQVEAVLYYQPLRPGFVAGLQHSGEKLDQFRGMYDARKPRAIPLARTAQSTP